ncbi:MAG: DUF2505 domain-containing protein [Candidatus Nanopelagicales bacterium]
MGTKFNGEFTFNADAETAFGLISDAAYQKEKNEKTGGSDVEATRTDLDNGGVQLVVTRTLPAEVPSFAKKLVGETIETTQTDTWDAANEDGSRNGRTEIEFKGSPMSVTGTYKIANDGSGSKMTMNFEAKASVPLIGGKIEKVVVEQTNRSVEAEQKIIDSKL